MSDQLLQNIKDIKSLSGDQFNALLKISELLNSTTYEESLIESALDLIIQVINAERGLFVKYADENFQIVSARNFQYQSLDDLKEFSTNILNEVITKKEPVLYHDMQSDPQVSQYESVQIQNIKSVIGVPVLQSGKIWGVVLADSQKDRREFTNENLLFLSFFSNLLTLALEKVNQLEKLQDENRILANKLESSDEIPEMVGSSDAIKRLAKLIHKVAQTDATVLILGESGTGKDLAAKAIHKLSNRKDKPFLAQFCGSIPDNLLESELFGYKKGAFTGASSDKKGLLEVADEGTFFLDEIADISSALQAKLLRVLENKEIMRLGDTKIKKINVRILAATNKNLPQLVEEGKFREDLFYRLNVFPIKLPPLRERKDDIPLLADFLAKKLSGTQIKIHPNAVKKLQSYFYPGNVRQLQNVIQRAIILCDNNRIETEHIIIEEQENIDRFNGTLKEFEKLLLKKRLDECGGNRTQAAKSLGVSIRWVQSKLKEIEEENSTKGDN
ncbi:MAG: sigma 54-interacting transcriptional regulator [Ignavibacteriae bacterium]|nr:GAF domain-containing protein [Ignavibacteriota bacterium]NOG98894.1 sigma 54-interacting transcriptional regulator [Ignavibacteriota bacterium]